MRRFVLTLFGVFLGAVLLAQQTIFDFESLVMPDTGFWNGSDTSVYQGGYGDGNVFFYNSYNAAWDAWSGFAFSNWTDTTTEGFANQWSTYAGQAFSGENFGLAYIPSDWNNNYQLIPVKCEFSSPQYPVSIAVTNTTYTALAIKNGTNFSQPFEDGDYYVVKIYGYYQGEVTDSVVHFLADYRDGNTFVQKDWQVINLTSLGLTDSLKFTVFSTDTGQYGTNTPAYFCFDDFVYSSEEPSVVASANQVRIYPNPAADFIYTTLKANKIEIFDLTGKKVLEGNGSFLDISGLNPGVYSARIINDDKIYNAKFVKN